MWFDSYAPTFLWGQIDSGLIDKRVHVPRKLNRNAEFIIMEEI